MLKKQKYYTLKRLLENDCEYNMILGARSNGKSYAVKHYCIEDYWKNGKKFIYLRRFGVEIKVSMVEAYFNDADIQKITKGERDCISIYRSGIYLAHYDDTDGRVVRDEQIGMVMSLSLQSHYKSMSMLEYKNIIFEEFITNSCYIDNETNELQQLVSTIARNTKVKVFLIGNTISRLCPYFNEWQLYNIPKQKQGTIEVYHMKTESKDENGEPLTVNVAVELCEEPNVKSTMFFGSVSKSMTGGTWETEEQAHLPFEYSDCKPIYSLTVVTHNMFYVMEILNKDNDYMIFVHPTKKIRTQRIIQKSFDIENRITSKLVPVCNGDKLMLKLLYLNKICFSDNLTGTEFLNGVLPLIK